MHENFDNLTVSDLCEVRWLEGKGVGMYREKVAISMIRLLMRRPWLANALFRFDPWGNIFGPDRFVDPYPIYERMRPSGPLSFSPLYQQWAIVGYEEAREVLTSSRFGVRSQLDMLMSVHPHAKVSDHTKALLRNVLLLTDPPKHTRLRSLVNRSFTRRQIARLEPRIAKLVHELLADMADDPSPDVVSGFTGPLPINVIADLLGVPEERWPWVMGMSARIRDVFDPIATPDPRAIDATFDEITQYYSSLADRRLAEPQDDLITGLVHAEEDGNHLDRDELISVVALLMFAGQRPPPVRWATRSSRSRSTLTNAGTSASIQGCGRTPSRMQWSHRANRTPTVVALCRGQ